MSSHDLIIEKSGFLKLNRAMALSFVIKLAQSLDRGWPNPSLLARLIEVLRWCQGHPQDDVRQLAARAHVWKRPDMSYEHFLAVLVPLERDYAKAVVDDDFLAHEGDQDPSQVKIQRWPLHVICDNIRSSFNVGSIFRSADCLGVEQVHLSGYTAKPDHPKTLKAAMGTERWVQWQWYAHGKDAITAVQKSGLPVIAIETLAHAPSIYQFSWPRRCALMFGNERHGLAADLIRAADHVCQIPVYGYKNSLNIATAFALTAGEVVRHWSAIKD